jgi:hypothetical protein
LGNAPSDGGSVFYGNSDLTSILRSVDATGWGAFWSDLPVETPVETVDEFRFRIADGVATVIGCDGTCPTNLVIPADLDGYVVMHIDASAFYGSALEFLTLPSSITTIGDDAFAGNLLTTVTIPNSVTTIGDEAFAWNLLTTVTIPNSVTSIGDDAFAGNSLTTVTIPNSVTSIGAGAFSTNALTTVTIPNSVTTIGPQAFYSNALTTVTIGNSVTSIGSFAFHTNALTSVTFLGNAPTAGTDVFTSNSGLTSVTRSHTATGWGSTWSGVAVVIADARATATVKPKVTGTAKVAKTLTAAGTWTGYPTPALTYKWYACTKAVSAARETVPPKKCKKIKGATRITFKLKSKQRGKYVAVLVTGTSLGTAATTWLSKTTARIR